ncbi:hypothetical protein BLNAU_6511 [Blattamonas nauphoetae]|uniref:Uncharacterized protein n=1 Tax=Blattamonas nauphoetae TaxID=2049346 RepID=A0ABQ9Y3Z5_9EUKA|nr:hypothetical protein BLNAU_6511 [Blattamonas nauphoetae]
MGNNFGHSQVQTKPPTVQTASSPTPVTLSVNNQKITRNFRPPSPVDSVERTSLREKLRKSFEDTDASVTETMSRISEQNKLALVTGGGHKKLLPVFLPILVMSSLLIGGAMIAMFIVVLNTFNFCTITTCFEGNGIEFILSDDDIEDMLIFRMKHEDISNLIPSYEEVDIDFD